MRQAENCYPSTMEEQLLRLMRPNETLRVGELAERYRALTGLRRRGVVKQCVSRLAKKGLLIATSSDLLRDPRSGQRCRFYQRHCRADLVLAFRDTYAGEAVPAAPAPAPRKRRADRCAS